MNVPAGIRPCETVAQLVPMRPDAQTQAPRAQVPPGEQCESRVQKGEVSREGQNCEVVLGGNRNNSKGSSNVLNIFVCEKSHKKSIASVGGGPAPVGEAGRWGTRDRIARLSWG